jgi:hypothetical protein
MGGESGAVMTGRIGVVLTVTVTVGLFVEGVVSRRDRQR